MPKALIILAAVLAVAAAVQIFPENALAGSTAAAAAVFALAAFVFTPKRKDDE